MGTDNEMDHGVVDDWDDDDDGMIPPFLLNPSKPMVSIGPAAFFSVENTGAPSGSHQGRRQAEKHRRQAEKHQGRFQLSSIVAASGRPRA